MIDAYEYISRLVVPFSPSRRSFSFVRDDDHRSDNHPVVIRQIEQVTFLVHVPECLQPRGTFEQGIGRFGSAHPTVIFS